MEFQHVSVLRPECIEALNIRPDGVYADATTGGGGHSLAIAQRLETGRLICFDRDAEALAAARLRLAEHLDKVTFVQSNFEQLKPRLAELNIPALDGILFDLGVSSYQLDNPERGFSYMQDAPLDMRMDRSQPYSAWNTVNEESFEELRRIITPIAQAHGLRSVSLFGSYSKGTARRGSDVDLKIEKGGVMSLFQISGLRLAMEDALQVPVDLVTNDASDRDFLNMIAKDEVLLYRSS